MTKTHGDELVVPSSVASPLGRRAASTGPDSPRRRLINLMSRHPDLVDGQPGRVAFLLCREVANVLGFRRVGIWKATSGGARFEEVAFNGSPIAEVTPRELVRADQAALCAAFERRRLFAEAELVPAGFERAALATLLVRGEVWGALVLEGAARGSVTDADLDFALLVAEMLGRALERRAQRVIEDQRDRAERAVVALGKLVGDGVGFEAVAGEVHFLADARAVIGLPPRGDAYRWADIMARIDAHDLELVQRRYRGWLQAGTPGVLTVRFAYRGLFPNRVERDLAIVCRLMGQAEGGAALAAPRLWGLMRLADEGPRAADGRTEGAALPLD